MDSCSAFTSSGTLTRPKRIATGVPESLQQTAITLVRLSGVGSQLLLSSLPTRQDLRTDNAPIACDLSPFSHPPMSRAGESVYKHKFAPDSLLEGDGFELPVPVRQAKLTRFCR
jgi:hypothetical protein